MGLVNGNNEHQRPKPVGTAVRSTIQTWLGYLEVMTRFVDSASVAGCGAGIRLSLLAEQNVGCYAAPAGF